MLKNTIKKSRDSIYKTKKNITESLKYKRPKKYLNIENISAFVTKNINESNYKKYMSQFTELGEKGKSGINIGSISDGSIMKVYSALNDNIITYNQNCNTIPFNINEVLINVILNNLPKYIKILPKHNNKIQNHIIKLKDWGFGINSSYIILEKIGIQYDNTYYTNINDILHSHLKILKKQPNLLHHYDLFLTSIFSDYIEVLKLLQKYISYLNTDNKLANIFVKYSKNTNPEFQILRDNGIYIDFILCISDLDKAIYKINDIKYVTNYKTNILLKLLKNTKYSYIHNIRTQCEYNSSIQCNLFDYTDLDIGFATVNIYLLYKYYNLYHIDTYLKNYNKLLITQFPHYTKDIITKLTSYIPRNIVITPIKFMTYIVVIFISFCKKYKLLTHKTQNTKNKTQNTKNKTQKTHS